ncbi:polyprenyl synthetase family protein [Alicyclobacillus shizuokensis]|uniref:polyprenyl synthetase family protein n=1 Tax=Alicyclobacillus shizuokensis TaxID=392014 RepID=UPI000835C9FA|nr:polyprenyl synthetase family protein [Alicyclobacillus shizuokensis]MCL6625689.1 polyprenyl synthetase family protein [Alicyclobacillus shizuokensis]
MEFHSVYRAYESDLQRVERCLMEAVASANPAMTQSARQLLEAGGKRIRPLFALMCSQLDGRRPGEQVYRAAAALELVHMASLVHDDVVDESDVRRGRPTVRARFGNRPAMYTGDFLFARAIQLLTTIDIPAVHEEMSLAMVRMCEGEIDQIRDFYNWHQSLRSYLRRVERKTALLISVSCAVGARVGGCDEATIGIARRFGHYTGMSFQITDDLLDFIGDAEVVGKPVGGDLRQGNLTLPTLHALATGPHARELRSLVHTDMDASDVEQAVRLIRSSNSLDYARSLAERYLDKAMAELDLLPADQVVTQLRSIAQFVNQRVY